MRTGAHLETQMTTPEDPLFGEKVGERFEHLRKTILQMAGGAPAVRRAAVAGRLGLADLRTPRGRRADDCGLTASVVMTFMLHCNIALVEAFRYTYIFRMDTHEAAFTIVEHEWRTSVTVIQAAAEILRDYALRRTSIVIAF